MKRSEMLTSLSHDHHQALRMSQVLRRCTRENANEAREEFERFWAGHKNHIRVEEEILLPKFAEYRGEDDPMIARLLEEHATASKLADEVFEAADPPVETMHELAEVLHSHTRFEERELFLAIEEAVPEEEQTALMEALRHAETSPDWQHERR